MHDTFRPIPTLKTETESNLGYVWLSYKDKHLTQWDEYCLPKNIFYFDNPQANQVPHTITKTKDYQHKLLSTYLLKSFLKVCRPNASLLFRIQNHITRDGARCYAKEFFFHRKNISGPSSLPLHGNFVACVIK